MKVISKFQNSGKFKRIKFTPEQISEFETLKVPGMNTNSNTTVQQANQKTRKDIKVKQDTPKTIGEGKARNNARHRQNGTTPDSDYTQRRIAEENQRTWRSDFADASHFIGETAMASTPITATSYFGAKALDNIIHGNVNAETAMDIGVATMPWLKPFRAASVTTTANQMNEIGRPIAERARAAAYNNITPLGYNDSKLGNLQISKKQDFKNTALDFLSPKKLSPNVDNPKWMERLKAQPLYSENYPLNLQNYDGSTYNVIKLEDMLDFRNQAWAKAMRQKAPNHKLYLENGDGTVSYNMDYVNQRSFKWNPSENKYVGKGWNGQVGSQPNIGMKHFDSITGNAGGVGIVYESPKTPFGMGKKYMIDKWDLQPFAQESRTLSPFITKHFPKFSKNFEAVSFVGGNPFNLKQEIPINLNLYK